MCWPCDDDADDDEEIQPCVKLTRNGPSLPNAKPHFFSSPGGQKTKPSHHIIHSNVVVFRIKSYRWISYQLYNLSGWTPLLFFTRRPENKTFPSSYHSLRCLSFLHQIILFYIISIIQFIRLNPISFLHPEARKQNLPIISFTPGLILSYHIKSNR